MCIRDSTESPPPRAPISPRPSRDCQIAPRHRIITVPASSPSSHHHRPRVVTVTASSPSPRRHPRHVITVTASSPSPRHRRRRIIVVTTRRRCSLTRRRHLATLERPLGDVRKRRETLARRAEAEGQHC
eukprot:3495612-Pyramimonas_sp.AAC.2